MSPTDLKTAPAPSSDLASAGAILTVDLDAVAANYRQLQSYAPGAEVAGVVKANAYGLGLAPVVRTLADAGCKTFFVADATEGVALRAALPEATIYVTNGLAANAAGAYRGHGLRPCLASLGEIKDWRREAKAAGRRLPAALHFDTGMSRLGLIGEEAALVLADRSRLDGIEVSLVMSHLACSDEAGHPLNARQLARFKTIRAAFPGTPASFANSSGILLGPEYHFDLVRPGYGLYGGTPFEGKPNPFRPTVKAEARVLQVRDVAEGETAGYGATWEAKGVRRLAVLSVGYADGYFRRLSSSAGGGRVWLGGQYAPVAGRVSMDLLIVDATGIPEGKVRRGDLAELIGPHVSLDEVANRAGTIGYEVLTSLGERYKRLYTGKTAAAAES
ncbi:MAG: alanine racemase [Parvibaculum sp.]|uniref:alanine racemase n=1 Tax=Parvibaculum sp. TaxID=2024848 RepID=UPI0028410A5E|nr:alanine racemase [Parvibaculum sp.]MDR3500861.1 alanine racemase [Parvibaculum sp.]